ERRSGSVCHVRLLLLPAVLYHSIALGGAMTSSIPPQLSQRRPLVRTLAAAFAVACALAGISAVTTMRAESHPSSVAVQSAARTSSPAFNLVEKSISDLQSAMRSGQLTSHQLVDAYLARIKKYDQDGPHINAFIVLNPQALAAADALDSERRSKGPRGMLHGIPIVVKDNYVTADMPTTGGSKALAGFESGRDAFMVKKLR